MSSKRKGNIYLGSVKRKKSVMTLTEKVELLDLLKSGKSAAAVGRHYGINESTVRYIKKQENEIRKVVLVTPAISAKTLHQIRNTLISRTENDTFIWIQDCHKQDIPLNSNMIMKKAKTIYDALKTENNGDGRRKESDFSASKGWLDNFTRRFGLSKSSKLKKAVNSVDQVAAKDFPAFLDVIVEENGFSPKQWFKTDERGEGFSDKKLRESSLEYALDIREPNEKKVLDMTTPKPASHDEVELLKVENSPRETAQEGEQLLLGSVTAAEQTADDEDSLEDKTTSENNEEELLENIIVSEQASQDEEELLRDITTSEKAAQDGKKLVEGITTSEEDEEELLEDITTPKEVLHYKEGSRENITTLEHTAQDQLDITISKPSTQVKEEVVKDIPEEHNLTLESLSVGFAMAKSLTDWFHDIDWSNKRAFKMKEGVEEALAPYRTIYKQLKFEKSQPKITKYFKKVVP